jgi:hypothetical protein
MAPAAWEISGRCLINYHGMWLNIVRFISILSTAITFGAGLAHLLALSNKMKLSNSDYLTVQQIYRGWALLGIAVVLSLLSTFILTVMAYNQKQAFFLPAIALVCITATLLIFWIFIYPVNQQTNNWTVLPDNWLALRNRWEFSHAVDALLNLIALGLLILYVLPKNK